jgi:hypothetical protein
MAGKKFYTQIDMKAPATEETHLVPLGQMIEYVAGKVKNPVRVVLSTNFAGTYDGTGKTLTQATPAEIVVDGVTLAIGDRVLLTGQTDKTQNGIYTVTTLGVTAGAAGVITRAADWDETSDIVQHVKVPVAEGAANADSTYVLTTDPPYALDSGNIEFARDSGDLSKVVQLEFDIVGDASTVNFTFSHNLNTRDVTAELYDVTSGETVEALVTRASVNDISVTFGAAPAVGEDYRLLLRAWRNA